ncbi:MAG TPA: hypothetical protein VFV52_02985 [Bacilli bacterium]|nr:hypothetical protein [Bacilli bacterium]
MSTLIANLQLDLVSLCLAFLILMAVIRHVRRHAHQSSKWTAIPLGVIGLCAVLEVVLFSQPALRFGGAVLFFVVDFYLTGRAMRRLMREQQQQALKQKPAAK